MGNKMKKIVIVGVYSAAKFFKGASIPLLGQTIIADEFFETNGGKGSNQAVAAAIQGGDVKIICKIGKDRHGEVAKELYRKTGIDSASVLEDEISITSVGAILIDRDGNNSIMTHPGASENLSFEEIKREIDTVDSPFVVGFQLENNTETVMASIRYCSSRGIPVLLDPAPAEKLPDEIYPNITYIKPNEIEAEILTGIEILSPDDALKACRWFLDRGVKTSIITLGEKGTVYMDAETQKYFKPISVNAIDTTGAGDVFSGSLMAALSGGAPAEDAILYASCAASISVTRMGVVESVPTIEETNLFMAEVMKSNPEQIVNVLPITREDAR
jgi:ribokinase